MTYWPSELQDILVTRHLGYWTSEEMAILLAGHLSYWSLEDVSKIAPSTATGKSHPISRNVSLIMRSVRYVFSSFLLVTMA